MWLGRFSLGMQLSNTEYREGESMPTARRVTRALMAVSTFIRAPWGISLAVKATLNARQRSYLHGSCVARSAGSLPRRTAASGTGEAALLLDTTGVETDGSTAVLREMGVSESKVLSKEAWMARAEAHRTRCVSCQHVNQCRVRVSV